MAETIIAAVLPSLVVSIFMVYFNRRQSKRDKDIDERATIRQQESLLSLELQMATAKMSFATAIALKRGYANGEVEDGIKAYEAAKKKYLDFLNQQATTRIAK